MWKGADPALITPDAFPDNLEASIKHGYEVFQANYKDAEGKTCAYTSVDATGVRLRTLPLRPNNVQAAFAAAFA